MTKCPICYTELDTGVPIEQSEESGIGSWTDDPLKTPNHFLPAYRGIQIIRERHITELRTKINQYETNFGISPITTWTTISAGVFVPRPQYINELREAVEGILTFKGVPLSDWLSYDENDEPTLGITDWLGGNRLPKDGIVRAMHIEELRKKIAQLWEDFEKVGTASISAIGKSTGDSRTFTLQKNQFWYGSVSAGIDTYSGGTSHCTSSMGISNLATGLTNAAAVANPNHVGVNPYVSSAGSNAGITAIIPVESGITAYPCARSVYNNITEVYDTYHLFVKATCSASVSASGGYTLGVLSDVFLALGSPTIPPPEVVAWNAKSIVPNPSHQSRAEVILSISTMFFGGSGFVIQWVKGTYHNSYTPTVGISYDLNNFDIDIGQTLVDTYSVDPTALYATTFNIACNAAGLGNSWDMKASDAYWIPDPLIPGGAIWYGPYYPTGGHGDADANFSIDDINFYYKLMTPP